MVLVALESGALLSSEERRWYGNPWTMVGERQGPSNTESLRPKPLFRLFHAPWRCSISKGRCSHWSVTKRTEIETGDSEHISLLQRLPIFSHEPTT